MSKQNSVKFPSQNVMLLCNINYSLRIPEYVAYETDVSILIAMVTVLVILFLYYYL